jgi:hypothetical protein
MSQPIRSEALRSVFGLGLRLYAAAAKLLITIQYLLRSETYCPRYCKQLRPKKRIEIILATIGIRSINQRGTPDKSAVLLHYCIAGHAMQVKWTI